MTVQELLTRAQDFLSAVEAEGRDLTEDETREYDTMLAQIERRQKVDAITRSAVHVEGSTGPVRRIGEAPMVNTRTAGKPWEVRDLRDHDEVAGRALDCLATRGATDEAVARVEAVIDSQAASHREMGELARRLVSASSPDYTRAFLKLARDPLTGSNSWTTAERAAWQTALEARAMSIGTDTAGGFAVPTHLDPSIILTNSGSTNALREVSRVVTLSVGDTWNGISSAGVTASFDVEASEVSDDSPTLAQPTVAVHQAQIFVPFSMQAADDIANLESELLRLFADAKDRLEGEKFSTGTGTGEPFGIFTAVEATAGSKLTSTTAATIGEVDLQSMYYGLPVRHRGNAKWLMNPRWALAIKALGTAVSSNYSGDLREAPTGTIYDKPVLQSDDAPATTTTTALDNRVMFGDFSNYVIVDRIGLSAELVPHLFHTTSNRPSGQRGLYARWRVGADSVNDDAMRLLQDRTSA